MIYPIALSVNPNIYNFIGWNGDSASQSKMNLKMSR